MQFSDRQGKNTETKLLPFRSPAPTLHGFGGMQGSDQAPHDIAVLRRPTLELAAPETGESKQLPQLSELDSLAHDARNLLTSLSLLSGLLGEPGVLGATYSHYAGDLQQVAGSLASMVERMAALPVGVREPVFAREPLRGRLPSADKGSAARVALRSSAPADAGEEAGALVKSCERLLAAVAGPRVALHISYERGLGPLAMGEEELTRVLMNLVKNASEAMPTGGRIAITVRRALGTQPAALIQVEDTGAGIPAHALGQVFQAGFTSKKNGRGWPATAHHGLGLTIVRDLVEGAGGTIRVSSTLRKGTHFELKVPCRRAQAGD